jgi:hypothetical protein
MLWVLRSLANKKQKAIKGCVAIVEKGRTQVSGSPAS